MILEKDVSGTNITENFIYEPSTYNESNITSGRPPIFYPWRIHFLAVSVFLANCTKIPQAVRFVRDNLPMIIPETLEITPGNVQAATAGAAIMCLLSGLFGALVLYLLHRRQARTTYKDFGSTKVNFHDNSMWLLIFSWALIFPDLWFAASGSMPYTSWYFLTAFTIVALILTMWKGRPRDILATLPSALLLGAAL